MMKRTRTAWDYARGAAKAVLAGAVAATGAAAVAAADDVVTTGEWWTVAAAGVAALGAAYGIRNTGPRAPR